MGGLNPGLVVNDDLAALKGSGMLPDAQIAVEVWCSFDRPVPPSGDDGRIFGGLVGARMDKGGVKGQLFGRGWGLGYEHDIERNETIVSFSLSLAGTDGTMHTLGAHISPIPSPGEMFHIVGMYDGSQVSIYVDGQLYSSSNPCGESTPCGGILNPVAADSFYTEGQKTRLTLGVVYNGRRGTSELHRGAMRMVRIMKEAMSPLEISAAADRFEYDLSSDPCPPGFYGPYEGRQPCFPCEAGRAQHLQGALSCDLCSLGYFSPGIPRPLEWPFPSFPPLSSRMPNPSTSFSFVHVQVVVCVVFTTCQITPFLFIVCTTCQITPFLFPFQNES